ncbi:unnamed protein product [Phaeothamnion confervicola]
MVTPSRTLERLLLTATRYNKYMPLPAASPALDLTADMRQAVYSMMGMAGAVDEWRQRGHFYRFVRSDAASAATALSATAALSAASSSGPLQPQLTRPVSARKEAWQASAAELAEMTAAARHRVLYLELGIASAADDEWLDGLDTLMRRLADLASGNDDGGGGGGSDDEGFGGLGSLKTAMVATRLWAVRLCTAWCRAANIRKSGGSSGYYSSNHGGDGGDGDNECIPMLQDYELCAFVSMTALAWVQATRGRCFDVPLNAACTRPDGSPLVWQKMSGRVLQLAGQAVQVKVDVCLLGQTILLPVWKRQPTPPPTPLAAAARRAGRDSSDAAVPSEWDQDATEKQEGLGIQLSFKALDAATLDWPLFFKLFGVGQAHHVDVSTAAAAVPGRGATGSGGGGGGCSGAVLQPSAAVQAAVLRLLGGDTRLAAAVADLCRHVAKDCSQAS